MEAGSTAVVSIPWKYAVGNNLRNASERFHQPSAEHAELWKQAQHYLNMGQYEQLRQVLQKAQQLPSGNVDDAQVLAAARELYAAHQQASEEVESLRKAQQEALEREQSLEQELRVLLEITFAEEPQEPALVDKSLKSRFLQYIHRFVRPDAGKQRTNSPNSAPSARVSEALTSGNQPPAHRAGLQVVEPMAETAALPAAQAEAKMAQTGARAVRSPLAAAALPSPMELQEERSLVIHSLGPFRVIHDGRLISDWNGLKGLAVLKYLVAQRGKPVSKDILMEAIWPESDPEAARRNLHQAIYSLRQTLQSDKPDFRLIEFHNDRYQINPTARFWIDFVAFEELAQEGQQLAVTGQVQEALQVYSRAEELYQGDFLEGDLYEEWAVAQREQLRLLYLEVASWLTEQYVKRREFTAAIGLSQKILTQDACHEQAHRCLMVSYAALGQRHLAVRQYLTCVRALRAELDLSPSPETTALYQQIAAVN
jgi:DNA-binding SARP family transcriptional activator